MYLLIVKTSSLGDVVHTLPAINDVIYHYPDLKIDWVVEETFVEVPAWHPAINRVIPVAIRRWRKQLFIKKTWREIKACQRALQKQPYDMIIDLQGLLKSAILCYWAKGKIHGYDKNSIREKIATYFYHHHYVVRKKLHAVSRNRQLMAKIFDYDMRNNRLHYGITNLHLIHLMLNVKYSSPYLIILHGTSRIEKEWHQDYWLQLINALGKKGIKTRLPWGNRREYKRANYLATQSPYAEVLGKYDLTTLSYLLQQAKFVIGVDTGLMHIAAALEKKCIALYPVTKPELCGVVSTSENNKNIHVIYGKNCLKVDRIIQISIDLL